MANPLLCLDIHNDFAAAALIDRSTKIGRLTRCAFVEMRDQSFAEVIDRLKEQTGFVTGACIVTFGAEFFSFRNITLPFSDKKKIEQVLPFELDDRLPFEVKTMLVDFAIAKTGANGAEIVAAAINREYISSQLDILSAKGIIPESVGISGISLVHKIIDDEAVKTFILLDAGQRWTTIFIVVNGQISLIRSLALPAGEKMGQDQRDDVYKTIQQTLLASRLLDMDTPTFCLYFSGMAEELFAASWHSHPLGVVEAKGYRLTSKPTIQLDAKIQDDYRADVLDRVLAMALKSKSKGEFGNFHRDELHKSRSFLDYRFSLLKFAIPVLLLCIAAAIYGVIEYRQLSASQDLLRNQITMIFQKTLPEVTRIVNPVQQLQVVNNQIRATYKPVGGSEAAYTVIDLLAELSARIPQAYQVKFVRLIADANTIRIKAITGDFNTVDNTHKELQKSRYFKNVAITSANQTAQGDKVNFELKLDIIQE